MTCAGLRDARPFHRGTAAESERCTVDQGRRAAQQSYTPHFLRPCSCSPPKPDLTLVLVLVRSSPCLLPGAPACHAYPPACVRASVLLPSHHYGGTRPSPATRARPPGSLAPAVLFPVSPFPSRVIILIDIQICCYFYLSKNSF